MSTLTFIVVFLVSATEIISSAETKPVLEFITRGGNDGRVLSRWTGGQVSWSVQQLGLLEGSPDICIVTSSLFTGNVSPVGNDGRGLRSGQLGLPEGSLDICIVASSPGQTFFAGREN